MISLSVKEQSIADDTFQNLFLSIVRTPVPRDTSRKESYIYRVLTNDIIDETRKSEAYSQFIRRYGECCDSKTMQTNPEVEVIELEETHRMFQSLRRHLPAHQAKAVIESCVLGNNTGEAARKMDLDSKTYSQYLHRGKRKIRQLLIRKREKQGDKNEYVQK